jgi:hypothetical protein
MRDWPAALPTFTPQHEALLRSAHLEESATWGLGTTITWPGASEWLSYRT